MFVKFTTTNKGTAFIDSTPGVVTAVVGDGTVTRITLNGGNDVQVNAAPEDVVAALSAKPASETKPAAAKPAKKK
jgi:hypothetical protein